MNNLIKTLELVQLLAKITFYGSAIYVTIVSVAFFLKNIY